MKNEKNILRGRQGQHSYSPLTRKGFTLIEMIMTISIVAILSAISLPLFVDLSLDAEVSSVKQTAAALETAAQRNLSLKAIKSSSALSFTTDNTSCTQTAANSLLGSPLPSDYNLYSSLDRCGNTTYSVAVCQLISPQGEVATYKVPCTRMFP